MVNGKEGQTRNLHPDFGSGIWEGAPSRMEIGT
jgi:hypothetical protein